MAVRTVHICSVILPASSTSASPSLPTCRRCFSCCFSQFSSVTTTATIQFSGYTKLSRYLPLTRSHSKLYYGVIRVRSIQSLVGSVLQELDALRKRKRVSATVSATSTVGLTSDGELLGDKLINRSLRKGLLLEFKDSGRLLLAVALRPDGKKNWIVLDQNGIICSIKPQQVTFIVPGVEIFDQADIPSFIQKAEDNLDPTLLEFAWVELLEKNKSVTVEDMAEMIFGCSESLESYCVHLLLSKDEVYFTVMETKGSRSIYGPRPSAQVEELVQRKISKVAADKELQEFAAFLRSAKAMPLESKPSKSSWLEANFKSKVEALEAYATDTCKNDEQQKLAGEILKSVGLGKTASSSVNLLIDIGYFPVHVNLDLLKLHIHTDHSEEVIMAAERLLSESSESDPDEGNRSDLTHLKVYAIDVDEADELDDALSATRLQDGRIKVWIHVADPTRFLQPGSIVDKDALKRGTSVFLPTSTYPMFPEKLAMEGMSLKQGEVCDAVTVSVVLRSDGSIAEYHVENSIIRPTYMLTYESASELLYLNLEEERELKILSEAANLRLKWRYLQGAIDTASLEARVKVVNPEHPEPSINLYVENQADPAMRLVCEMMILCGEAIARFGSSNNIPLPYRGQPQSNLDVSAFSHLPEGPVRSSAIVKILRAAEIDFRTPRRHGVMGLPCYVQFTSPVRRYLDLLAHYQVKAFLRDDAPPFSASHLEGMASSVTMNVRIVRRLCSSSLRYWILEYLRRQPKEKAYRALVLRLIKDRTAALLVVEVGLQASAWVSIGTRVGDEIKVKVEESHPRDDILSLKEVL